MISVTILTKNSENTLFPVLKAIRSFDEVIVLDTGSTDGTLEIASGFSNVKIRTSPFIGFGPLHNLAANHTTHDWVLSLDSDEVLTEPLCQEILALALDPNCIYSCIFHNYFNGKWIKWCGWYPDRHVRLYNRKRTSFSNDRVHERILRRNMREIELKHPIEHYSYRSISDLLRKMEIYTDLFAKQNQGKKQASLSKALFHGAYAFMKSYLFQRGFIGGREGFIISLYKGQTAFYKYLKLWELNRDATRSRLP
ncbi:MAG: glycosyltransferase family 2 protein [Chlamydiota bacterium]